MFTGPMTAIAQTTVTLPPIKGLKAMMSMPHLHTLV